MSKPESESRSNASAHANTNAKADANKHPDPEPRVSRQFYHLTLHNPSQVAASAFGSFTDRNGLKEQVVLLTGSTLSLYEPDPDSGKLLLLNSTTEFANIRDIVSIRVSGSGKHLLSLASDSGVFTLVEFATQTQKGRWVPVTQYPYGRSGVRRGLPGQYIAADPKGRVLMLASIDNSKLVFVVTRDEQGAPSTASAIESHTPYSTLVALTGLDVGFENPVFGALELAPASTSKVQPYLTFYEHDLGLNTLVHSWRRPIPNVEAESLLALPGGDSGPSGVLLASTGTITYYHPEQEPVSIWLPHLANTTTKPYIVSWVAHKIKDDAFVLAQTQLGDVFKLSLQTSRASQPRWGGDLVLDSMSLQFFEFLPPATRFHIFTEGFLLACGLASDHTLYQFNKLGDGDDVHVYSSNSDEVPPFERQELENLSPVDKLGGLHPIAFASMAPTKSNNQKAFQMGTGNAISGKFTQIQFGISASELISTQLPGDPVNIATIKAANPGDHDEYIILSSTRATVVLSNGEDIEEVNDSGLYTDGPTLGVGRFGRTGVVQVHGKGLEYISATKKVTPWRPSGSQSVVSVAMSDNQLVLGLSDKSLVYFIASPDDEEGMPIEYQDHPIMVDTITCLGIGRPAKGALQTSFFAVGTADGFVRVFSLKDDSLLQMLSIQSLPSTATDLAVSYINSSESVLHVGLDNGLYVTSSVDDATHSMDKTLVRALGVEPVKFGEALQSTTTASPPAVLIFSTQTYVSEWRPSGYFEVSPLLFTTFSGLRTATTYSGPLAENALIGLHNSDLEIFEYDASSTKLVEKSATLAGRPRASVYSESLKLTFVLSEDTGLQGHIEVLDVSAEDPKTHSVQLPDKVSGIALAGGFSAVDNKFYLIVSGAKDLVNNGTSKPAWTASFIYLFEIVTANSGPSFANLLLVWSSEVPGLIRALLVHDGLVWAGVDNQLTLYRFGHKKLLKRNVIAPGNLTKIVAIQAVGNRLFVADEHRSVVGYITEYDKDRAVAIVDDPIPRRVSAFCIVDEDTVAVADKFGTVWVLEIPKEALDLLSGFKDPDLVNISGTTSALNGLGHKFKVVANIYVQDTPRALFMTSLQEGALPVLCYVGVQGTLGVLATFNSATHGTLMRDIEKAVSDNRVSLTGRLPSVFRGYYSPKRAVVDGDMCQQLFTLPADTAATISENLESSLGDLERAVLEMRFRIGF